MDMLTAKEAADFLGVQVSTLYAYVSRDLIESMPAPDDPRKRLYRRGDLELLKRRGEAHRGRGAAAAGALDWGAPSLETRISQITTSGPRYRGVLPTELVEGERSFEQVAEFLWSGEWVDEVQWGDAEGALSSDVPSLDTGVRQIDRLRVTLARAGLQDIGRFKDSPQGRFACARRIYRVVLAAVAARPEQPPQEDAGSDMIGRLMRGLGIDEDDSVRRALRAGLILIADHEMNASTFTARVIASTGADLYACVEGALTALSGPRHGGAADRCEALVAELERADSVADALLCRIRRGDSIPGFGHPLYPDGDPRFRKLCTTLPAVSKAHLELAADLEDAADALELGAPTIDLGLAILSDALGLADGGASTLFALGRLSGWIAHAIEQLEQGHLLRPRAYYRGE